MILLYQYCHNYGYNKQQLPLPLTTPTTITYYSSGINIASNAYDFVYLPLQLDSCEGIGRRGV
jgi:hypothetical protein